MSSLQTLFAYGRKLWLSIAGLLWCIKCHEAKSSGTTDSGCREAGNCSDPAKKKKIPFQLKETLSFLGRMKRLAQVSGVFLLTWARPHIKTMYV